MRTTPAAPWSESDLIQLADQASKAGLYLAGGILGRVALEHRLRLLCEVNRCNPKRSTKAGIPEFSGRLYLRRVIDKPTHTEIKRLANVGNRCAHNAGCHWFEVSQMLAGVREFLDRHAVDHHELQCWLKLKAWFDLSDDDSDDCDDDGEVCCDA